MVARSASEHGVEAGAEELDELVDDALLAQHLRDGEHEVGRGDAFACSLPVSLKPTTSGMSIEMRLAEHGRLRLDAADAPAEHARGR